MQSLPNNRGNDIAVPPKTSVIKGPLDNPAYTHEGVIYTNELVYEEIAADKTRGEYKLGLLSMLVAPVYEKLN